ncbi:MAG: 3-oxoacyl-ACP reductase [Chloroflexi bacterium]|nr:3-oxoacyl-ACP reductase [Chloroflexota bacterium]|tara:strand:- start:25300 stop:26079 length:780 start_codon:yes stop_codon:yes gene_type:complete
MDLEIKGKKALVCASSKGLGKACAYALVEEGVNVIINSRDEKELRKVQKELSLLGQGNIEYVVADLNSEEERDNLISKCSDIDILINNNGGPPPGNFLEMDREHWMEALESNLLVAIMLIKAFLPDMQKRNFGRIINITSAMVKSPHPMMGLSTSARAGLTAFSKGISKQVAKDNVTINNLLPERFDTERQAQMANILMETKGISLEKAREEISSTIAAKRFGDPKEFGATCAFLCSKHAGFISGQNIQLDGGSYQGLI